MKMTKKLIKRILAAALAAVMVIGGAVTAMAAEVGEYPLMGKLDELGMNYTEKVRYGSYDYATDTYGNPKTYNLFEWCDESKGSDAIWEKCMSEGTLKYYGVSSDYDIMVAIALLAGEQIAMNEGDPGLYFRYATETEIQHGYELAENIRQFLGTFENGWENASEYEKAVHICKWLRLARYDANTGVGGAYSCLINKACDCSGYTSAAMLLAHIVGIECFEGNESLNHEYPVFKINGVWLSYDPAANGTNVSNAQLDMSFTLYDMYKKMENSSNLSIIQFCQSQGYVVPDDLRDYFPSDYCKSIAGKDFGDGSNGIYGVVQMHDDCGHFPFNQPYTQ